MSCILVTTTPGSHQGNQKIPQGQDLVKIKKIISCFNFVNKETDLQKYRLNNATDDNVSNDR